MHLMERGQNPGVYTYNPEFYLRVKIPSKLVLSGAKGLFRFPSGTEVVILSISNLKPMGVIFVQ